MGNGNKVEFLVAICALLTSAMAVYMAWDQGRVMRAQQHGAVFPILQVDGYAKNTDDYSSLGIEVSNSGVGPALIESVTLLVDGVDEGGFGDFAQTIPGGYELSWSGLTGRALAPGEAVSPVDIKWPPNALDPETISQVTTSTNRWSLEICYCSVFQNCWKTREIGRSRATPVDTCERSETDIFENLGLQDLARQNAEAAKAAEQDTAEETPQ